MTWLVGDIERYWFERNQRSLMKQAVQRLEKSEYQGFSLRPLSISGRKVYLLSASMQQQGVLLAESILPLITESDNAIVFMMLSGQTIVIVKQAGKVVFDTRLDDSQTIMDKSLRSLTIYWQQLLSEELTIFHCADCSINVADDELELNNRWRLPYRDNLQFNTFNLDWGAVDEWGVEPARQLRYPKNLPIKRSLLGVSLLMTGAYIWWPRSEVAETVIDLPPQIIDHYAGFRSRLEQTGFNCKIRFLHLYEDMTRANSLRNWTLDSLDVSGEQTFLSLKANSNNASLREVEALAKQFDYRISMSTDAVILQRSVEAFPILKTAVMADVLGQIRYFRLALESFWGSQIKITKGKAEPSKEKNFVNQAVVIAFDKILPNDLDNVGSVFNGHPVEFISLNLTKVDQYYSGNATLNVLGSLNHE